MLEKQNEYKKLQLRWFQDWGTSHEDRLRELNLLSLEQQRERGDMIVIHKLITGKDYLREKRPTSVGYKEQGKKKVPLGGILIWRASHTEMGTHWMV